MSPSRQNTLRRAVEALAAGLLPGPGTVYASGGLLRDLVLDRPPRDVDLLIEGSDDARKFALSALERLSGMEPVVFERREPATYRVVLEGVIVDTGFCPPDGVSGALIRRDFTVNALAAPLGSLRPLLAPAGADSTPSMARRLRPILVDPAGGLEDILSGRLRRVSPASLPEDPLRLLRAVRLEATLEGFAIEDRLAREIAGMAERISECSAERIGAEMNLILDSGRAGEAIRRMDSVGLLDRILPELAPLAGVGQPSRYHDHDAREHSLRALEEAVRLARGSHPLDIPALEPESRLVFLWAALLHDTGKAAAATRDPAGTPHFYGHEEISAALAGGALSRLRMPRRIADPVTDLIRWHVRTGALASAAAGDRPIRRLVRLAGDRLELLLLLALADRRSAGGTEGGRIEAALVALCRRALQLRDEVAAAAASPPFLDGREVMEILGLRPGPRVGSILRWLERLRAEERLHSREEAVALLRSLPPSRVSD